MNNSHQFRYSSLFFFIRLLSFCLLISCMFIVHAIHIWLLLGCYTPNAVINDCLDLSCRDLRLKLSGSFSPAQYSCTVVVNPHNICATDNSQFLQNKSMNKNDMWREKSQRFTLKSKSEKIMGDMACRKKNG